jgi:hypothetical protein
MQNIHHTQLCHGNNFQKGHFVIQSSHGTVDIVSMGPITLAHLLLSLLAFATVVAVECKKKKPLKKAACKMQQHQQQQQQHQHQKERDRAAGRGAAAAGTADAARVREAVLQARRSDKPRKQLHGGAKEPTEEKLHSRELSQNDKEKAIAAGQKAARGDYPTIEGLYNSEQLGSTPCPN